MLNSKNKHQIKREATEESILDAFERVLIRDGVRDLTLNAVMKEARAAKPLLYKYFGDLTGVARAWGKKRKFWPETADLEALEPELYKSGDEKERLKFSMIHIANHLRHNPVSLEVLAEELASPSALSDAFEEIRNRRGSDDEHDFPEGHPARRRENFRLLHVIFSSVVYFALRARSAPQLQGIHLDTDEGWNDTMDMISEIIDDCILASKVRALVHDNDKVDHLADLYSPSHKDSETK